MSPVIPVAHANAGQKRGRELNDDDILENTSERIITPTQEMGISVPLSKAPALAPYLTKKDALVCVNEAPMSLARQMDVMRTDLISTVDLKDLDRQMSDQKFESFREVGTMVQFGGVPLLNAEITDVNDPEREPYKKIITDSCRQYGLPDNLKSMMLHRDLATAKHQVNFEFKFSKGEPGHFYYGKFMAQKNNGQIDFIILLYALRFAFAPSTSCSAFAQQLLWFTVAAHNDMTVEDKNLSEADLERFLNFFRVKMYKILADQIKGGNSMA